MGGHRVYRSLLRLYPASFRRRYGDDLLQHFADLVSDRGARAAWARTFRDLVVTVPRYRLESVMNEQHSAATVHVAVWALAAAGAVSVMVGLYPGVLLLGMALALAAGRRGQLAAALRTPDSDRRRRRLSTGLVLAAVSVASYAAFNMLVGDEWTVRETVLTVIGTPAMIGAVVFVVAGLLTPRTARV